MSSRKRPGNDFMAFTPAVGSATPSTGRARVRANPTPARFVEKDVSELPSDDDLAAAWDRVPDAVKAAFGYSPKK
ncbi:hypothetical protein [Ramlibacter sp.]|uniref:hypothetical protein n=1 Tax=Ramlibacter sp. TaxID=1917967 RepID=UPI003D0DC573